MELVVMFAFLAALIGCGYMIYRLAPIHDDGSAAVEHWRQMYIQENGKRCTAETRLRTFRKLIDEASRKMEEQQP